MTVTMTDVVERKPSKDDLEKERIGRHLAISVGLFMTAVTMVVPTRAPMVLGIKKGNAEATARTMGLMSSCAAAIEIFVNPVFGKLADAYGRKPFMLLAPFVDTILHLGVAAMPRSLAVTFADRMITGSMIFSFLAPVHAAYSDLFTGPKLAMAMARSGTMFGVGCTLGPFIGSKLSGAKSFAVSAIAFIVAFLYVQINVRETLSESKKKEFQLSACSPLRFLKLFSAGNIVATLAATIGLQSFGDYVNIYDINFLYLKTVLGYGQKEVGNFATTVGVTQIVGGETMKWAIKTMGQTKATAFSNLMWITAMAMLGSARTTKQVLIALFTMTFGHLRATGVSAFLQTHGQASGMGKAEIAAAQASLLAVLKFFIPMLNGNLFAIGNAEHRATKIPGLPYFFIAVLTGVAHLVFRTIDAEKPPAVADQK